MDRDGPQNSACFNPHKKDVILAQASRMHGRNAKREETLEGFSNIFFSSEY